MKLTAGLILLALANLSSCEWQTAIDPESTLQNLPLIDLGATAESAIALYGDPIETSPKEEFPEASSMTFSPDELHEVVITVWNGAVHQVVYWFEDPSPDEDLVFIAGHYRDGQNWVELNPGYLYYREDEEIRLWCSALPAIGVGTIEYFKAESAGKAQQAEALKP